MLSLVAGTYVGAGVVAVCSGLQEYIPEVHEQDDDGRTGTVEPVGGASAR